MNVSRFWQWLFPELTQFEDNTIRAHAWTNAVTTYWRNPRTVFVFFLIYFLTQVMIHLITGFPTRAASPQLEITAVWISLLVAIVLTLRGGRRHIQAWLRQGLNDSGCPTCLACGYNLTGLTEPRCPECGSEFDSSKLPHGGGMDIADE
jgi:hypothetical protein